jgi:hypothetical protein
MPVGMLVPLYLGGKALYDAATGAPVTPEEKKRLARKQAIDDLVSSEYLAGTNPTDAEIRSFQDSGGHLLPGVSVSQDPTSGMKQAVVNDSAITPRDEQLAAAQFNNAPLAQAEARRLNRMARLNDAGIDAQDYATQVKLDEIQRLLAESGTTRGEALTAWTGHDLSPVREAGGALYNRFDTAHPNVGVTPVGRATIDLRAAQARDEEASTRLRGEQVNTEVAQQGAYGASARNSNALADWRETRAQAIREFADGGDVRTGLTGGVRLPKELLTGTLKPIHYQGKSVYGRVTYGPDGRESVTEVVKGEDGQPMEVPPEEFSPDRATALQKDAEYMAQQYPGTTAQEWAEVKIMSDYKRSGMIRDLKAKSAEYQKNRQSQSRSSPAPSRQNPVKAIRDAYRAGQLSRQEAAARLKQLGW